MEATAPTVTISLTVSNGAQAMDFYRSAFEAVEHYRLAQPNGAIAHAELSIRGTTLYLSEEAPDWHARALPEGQLAPCLFAISSEDVDGDYDRAVAAGARSLTPPRDEFFGMRSAMVADPFGYRWSFGKVVEQLTPQEIEERAKAFYEGLTEG